MTPQQFRKRITTSETITIIAHSCAISQVYIAVASPGTTWKLSIQDKTSPNPFIIVPEVTLSSPTLADWKIQGYGKPLRMDGGVDIVTTGTPGVVAVWIDALL